MIDWTVMVFDTVEHEGVLFVDGGSGESSFRACRKRIIDAVTQSKDEEQLVIVELRGEEKDVDVVVNVYRSTGKVHCRILYYGIVEFDFRLNSVQELQEFLKFDFAEEQKND